MKLQQSRNIEDVRRLARKRLPRPILDYLEGGADDEDTLNDNIAAFKRLRLMPRALVDVAKVDLSTTLLGRKIDLPFLLAPAGSARLFHLDGENAAARAACRAGTIYCLSTMATTSLEDVASQSNGPRIFQLYMFRDRDFVADLVGRCKLSGYHALCLTIDCAVGGNRERDKLSGMTLPPSLGFKSFLQFASHPGWSIPAALHLNFGFPNFLDRRSGSDRDLSAAALFNTLFDRSVSWSDVEWLRTIWSGPLILKGILDSDDAERARQIGIDALVVSNHGGRQLDTVPAPIDRISAIRDRIGNSVELILDSGIRRGSDIVKALAAGADACLIGRPYLYGLAAGGEAGIDKVMAILKSEVERTMILLGTPTIADITADRLIKS